MSNKTYNDISYRKSQSDRLYELFNQKSFNFKRCDGNILVDSSKSEISNKDILCNTQVEIMKYSRKQGMCYILDGKQTSILQTSNIISASEKARHIRESFKLLCCT